MVTAIEYPIHINIYGVAFNNVIELSHNYEKHDEALEAMYNNLIISVSTEEALERIKINYPKNFEQILLDINGLDGGANEVSLIVKTINDSIKYLIQKHINDQKEPDQKTIKKEQSIKEIKSPTKTSKKKVKNCEKSGDICGDVDELKAWIEVEGAEKVLKELEEDYDIYKKSKDKDIYKDRLKKARKIANDVRKAKIKEEEEHQAKITQISNTVDSAMGSATKKTRDRIKKWIKAINDSPTPQDLQDAIADFLGGEYEEWKENDPIKAKFPKLEKMINDKVDPILTNIKPYYDLIMGIYNMNISLDTVVNIVSQVVLAQFAPFIDKYNQYTHTVNEMTSLTAEMNLLKSAIEQKANEFKLSTLITLPDIPTLPVIPPIPNPFGTSSPKEEKS